MPKNTSELFKTLRGILFPSFSFQAYWLIYCLTWTGIHHLRHMKLKHFIWQLYPPNPVPRRLSTLNDIIVPGVFQRTIRKNKWQLFGNEVYKEFQFHSAAFVSYHDTWGTWTIIFPRLLLSWENGEWNKLKCHKVSCSYLDIAVFQSPECWPLHHGTNLHSCFSWINSP